MATTRSEPQKENGSTAFYHHTCIVHTQSTMVGFAKIVSGNHDAEILLSLFYAALHSSSLLKPAKNEKMSKIYWVFISLTFLFS